MNENSYWHGCCATARLVLPMNLWLKLAFFNSETFASTMLLPGSVRSLTQSIDGLHQYLPITQYRFLAGRQLNVCEHGDRCGFISFSFANTHTLRTARIGHRNPSYFKCCIGPSSLRCTVFDNPCSEHSNRLMNYSNRIESIGETACRGFRMQRRLTYAVGHLWPVKLLSIYGAKCTIGQTGMPDEVTEEMELPLWHLSTRER